MSTAPSLFENTREITALGDLYGNIWQVAYVTRDLDEGVALLRDKFGVESTEVPTAGGTFYSGDTPVQWDVRIAMGARGGLIVEVIEPIGGEVDFYRRFLPADGGAGLGFHHLAAHMPLGDEAWDSLESMLATHDLGVEYTLVIPDRVRAGYVDTTGLLGHYLEVCQLQPMDTELFDGLVAQSA
jgi:Glyoxalase/Bleomycin resistance protein/Dioxygenase superfamily